MLHTILGPDKFRAGTDLYFARHDGHAATCEDFVKAMEDAAQVDLAQFRLWYAQAGTPRIKAAVDHQPGSGRARIRLDQTAPPTPGQPDKRPMPVPLRLALYGEVSGDSFGEQLVLLDSAHREIVVEGVGERPVLSINRATRRSSN